MTTNDDILEILLSTKIRGDDGAWRAFREDGSEIVDAGSVLLAGIPAAIRLHANEVYDSWRTEQGVSPIRFEPVRSTTVTLVGHGANARSGAVQVESSRETVVVAQGSRACAGSACVEVSSGCVVQLVRYGARSGSRVSHVESSSVVRFVGTGSRSGSGRVLGSGSADVCPGSYFAGARSATSLPVFTVKNPTDEELIHIFFRARHFTN